MDASQVLYVTFVLHDTTFIIYWNLSCLVQTIIFHVSILKLLLLLEGGQTSGGF